MVFALWIQPWKRERLQCPLMLDRHRMAIIATQVKVESFLLALLRRFSSFSHGLKDSKRYLDISNNSISINWTDDVTSNSLLHLFISAFDYRKHFKPKYTIVSISIKIKA
jgi:hypothetical protein